jgi:purine-nucleoside phosphorylase
LTSVIEDSIEIPYRNIPHFPQSTVEGHRGSLVFGKINKTNVVVLNGRFHFYEGHPMQDIIYPIRVFKQLGVENLFLSNAAGGINKIFKVGDIMVITDHINLMPNPLVGKHDPHWGERFPDMIDAYDMGLIKKAFSIPVKNKVQLRKGVYLAVSGPTYETPAEYRAFRILGADAVGMSTVPEVIAARQMGIKCFAVSVITDLGVPGKLKNLTHKEVLKAAVLAEKKMTDLFVAML